MPINYVTGGLTDYGLPPYDFSGFVSATFILDAHDATLQGLCDRYLNGPLGRGAKKFVPGADDRMIMVCSTFPQVSADYAQPFGYSIYSETAFLFSVYDQLHNNWSWYVPVLYLDGPGMTAPQEWQAELPIAIGREFFGLPKTRAEIQISPLSHTGTIMPLDASTPGSPVTVTEAVSIDVTACEIPSVDDQVVVAEGELFGLEIEFSRRTRAGTLTPERAKQLQGEITKSKKAVSKLRAKRTQARRKRDAAVADLVRLHREPAARRILAPKDLIDMLWGGDPYGNVNMPTPALPELLQSLGFLESTTPPPEPQFGYEFDFRLLGLRQLRNPEKPNEASIQQVIRSQLLYDRLPWSPIQEFCVRIADPLTTILGVAPHNKLLADRVYVYSNANASFKDGRIVPQ